MTDREKLTDVIYSMDICSWDWAGKIADHLLANGVTFATDNNVGNEWIPVSERFPEKMKEVLVWSHGGDFAEAAFWEGRRWEKTWDHEVIYTVTHWMPLPEPPKEDN